MSETTYPVGPDVPAASLPHRGTIYALALGTFAVGTEGFMIAALLPNIAGALGVSVSAAGQLVTIFALVYAVCSPLLTALTAAWPRRRLLILVLLGFVAANLVAAIAPGYWTLAAARVLLALAAGLYVPNANALAGVLAGPAHRGRALGIVNGGITVAIAIGVPLGAFVGAHIRWRATFVGVAIMSAAAVGVLGLFLPDEIPGGPPATLRTRLAVAAVPGAFATLLTTTLWGMAAYAVYTYVAPYLSEVAGVTPTEIGGVLALYGVAALIGVTLGGRGNDRFGARRVQAVALPLLAASFALMTLTALLRPPYVLWTVLPLVVVWGISAWAFFPAQQSRLIGVVGIANTPVILSLNASFMYLGFALGAGLGSVIIASFGITWIGCAGALCVIGAIALSRTAWTRSGVVTARATAPS